jgi:hypothetical protein
MYARFIRDLPRFLRKRVAIDDANAWVGQRLANREEGFLRLVQRGIYSQPRSPYLFLLREAGCEYGDLVKLVGEQGLEGALGTLYDKGVYVSFDEFKGRAPIVRGSRTLDAVAEDFDNPHLRRHYESESGGSTGTGTRVGVELDTIFEGANSTMLGLSAHGLLNAPSVIWTSVLPNGVGVVLLLQSVLMRNVVRRWFAPVAPGDQRRPLRFRFAQGYIFATSRAMRVGLPHPEPLSVTEAVTIAKVSASYARQEGQCLVRAAISMSLRVALAARKEGIDLTGVTFMGAGEPPSAAKVSGIIESGARYVPTYTFSEGGRVGMGCANPIDSTDVHFFSHRLGVIQRPQLVPGTAATVNAFCYTSLLPTAPKLMLNMESDDFGVLERRSCGCSLEAAGFSDHIRQVRSARKLTGEGITLIGSDLERIMEELLPARFGGSTLDYQLVEEEDANGFTRITLLVSPELPISDEGEPVRVLLDALGKGELRADVARSVLAAAGTVRVRREKPVANSRGKLPPFKTVAHRR